MTISTSSLVHNLKSQEFNSAKFDVSPDGKLLAWVGRFGTIHLVSATSKELLRSLKMNDWCRELRFSRDGGSLYTTTTEIQATLDSY